MEENEARLFYKNKITKTIYLLSYVFLGLFGIVYSLVSGIGLIVENGKNPSSIYLYVALGFGIVSLLLTIITICLAYFHSEEGIKVKRFNHILVLKTVLRGINILGSLILLFGSFFGSVGYDVENNSWGNFIRFFAIFLLIIEGTAFLFSLWKILWRKENPERYAPGIVVKQIEKPKYTAVKVEKEEPKSNKPVKKESPFHRKEKVKQIDSKKQIENKETVKAIEVQDKESK